MKFEEESKYFPSGRMRVLAVDDNSTCLISLEALLRECQYHVTSAKDATTALEILGQNKKEFDLVITEVHLPDMDAFKLLEQVSNDIPVVLMSSDGDIELVMKGIRYGACDYLLKPVRIEVVKTIWQHVVRRKIVNNNINNDNKCDDQSSGTGSSGVSKKRKDDEENADDDHDHDQHKLGQRNVVVVEEEEKEDKVMLQPKQKKPRVVWLSELHRKFIAAVDQVGIDKAVPKRILELMKVEGITRENVASHLQKYRMNLKKLNKEANSQQANNSMLSSFDSAAYYGQVDNSRQCVSYPPASCHQWGHSDNNDNNNINNNNFQYPTNSSSMMVNHAMNNQSHEPTMPIATFVGDDFSINCDFANDINNTNNLMVDDQADSSLARDYSSKLTNLDRYYQYQNHNNSWPPTCVCYGQQGPNDFYLPTTSSAPHMLLPITHDVNFGTTPSPSVLRREFPSTPSCLHVDSRYDDGDHMNCGVGGFVSTQQPDDDGSREQDSGEHQQHEVSSPLKP